MSAMSRKIQIVMAILVLFAAASPSIAQTWTPIQTFPGYISFVKFTSERTAFVGLGVGPGGPIHGAIGLWRSTDAGAHWTECHIPPDYSGEATDLLMTDSLNGWATVVPYLSIGKIGLWRTSDGGVTWKETVLASACTSVRVTPSAIVTTDIFAAGHTSLDGGNTFISGVGSSSNCVDFVDDKHGVSSCYRGKNWQTTSDGGLTWESANEVVESWSVYGVPGTSRFYAAPEGPTDGSPYTSVVLQSTDYGKNWNVRSTLPFITTGTIQGVGDDELYIQVSNNGNRDSLRDGIFRSTDKGATWTDLGGPGALSDSRFAVLPSCAGTAVFAFDSAANGTLYRLGLPSNGDYYAPYFSGFYRPAINTDVSIPISIRLPTSLNLSSRNVSRVSYRVTIDASDAVVSSITPAPGWQLSSFMPAADGVSVSMSNISSAKVEDSMYLGILTVHAKQNGLTAIRTENFAIVVDSQAISLCLAAEGNISALINADENSSVRATQTFAVQLPGLHQTLLSSIDDGPLELQLIDEAGRVIDAKHVTMSSHELEYAPGPITQGPYLLILQQGKHYELHKLIVR